MKIAIDVSPLQTGHKIRGVGFYLHYLKQSLQKYFPKEDFIFFNDRTELHGAIDIIHYPYFDPFFVSLPITKKVPTIVTVHDLTPIVFPEHFPSGIKGKLKWQIQKINLRKIDKIITDSEASKNDIIKHVGIDSANIAVVYLAADEVFQKRNVTIEEKKILQKQYGLPDKFALYVGDVTWNKNLPNLIRAAKKANIPLVMVGKSLVETDYDHANPWNADRTEVQKLAENNENVLRLGFIPTEDLVMLYNIAQVFVMPSHYEGFGLPIIEAMQSGCPVITTKNGSLEEVAGDAAVYTDGMNIQSLSKDIENVFNNESLRMKMSKKGLERATLFTWEKAAKQTYAVYKEIVNV